MKLPKRHRFWTAGVITLALFSFLTGSSLACLQKGIGSAKLAEDCCKGHCQHVMATDMAAKCCQSHQTRVSHTLPASSATKVASLAVHALYGSLIPPIVLLSAEQLWVRFSTGKQPPQSPPIYTLHCTLLI